MIDRMMTEEYAKRISMIWRKNGFEASQYVGCALYIMCLKKMIEENECKMPEYLGTIVELTKVLYRPIAFEDIEKLKDATRILEETYGIQIGMLEEILNPFRHQEEAWKKTFLDIIVCTSEIIVDDAGYLPYALELINYTGKMNSKDAVNTSSDAVADLLSIASNIQDGDRVLDGTIGYGYSAIKCIEEKKNIALYGVEINRSSIQIATLLMILKGDVQFEIKQEDFSAMNLENTMDRVVMDIPFGMRTNPDLIGQQLNRIRRWMDADNCREMECLFIASALDALKENGRFVVIVPQGILFKQTKAVSTMRENLVKAGMLKAIISLPAVYNSTSLNTAMLVFEKGNEEVLFVDAATLITRERRNDAFITAENKALLSDILENKNEIEGISFLVNNEKLIEVGDWSITRYQTKTDTMEFRTVEEINKDLLESYKKLNTLTQKMDEIELFH